MSNTPVRDRLKAAIADNDAETIVRIGMRSVVQADRGNVCQCPAPEHVNPGGGKGDLMCGICGLRDDAAQAVYEAEFHNHEFVESDTDLKRSMGWCGYCTFKRDHTNHHPNGGTS